MKDDRQILNYERPDWTPDEVKRPEPFISARPDIKRGRVLALVLQRTRQQRATDRKLTAWAIFVCAALALACVIAAQFVGGRV